MLTAEQTDILRELVNVGIGKAAYSLSELVDARVGLKVPELEVGSFADLESRRRAAPHGDLSVVAQTFGKSPVGVATLAFPRASAGALVSLLVGEGADATEIDAEREGVLLEVGNIIINGVMGSLGNLVDRDVQFGLPTYCEGEVVEALGRGAGEERPVVLVDVVLAIQSHAIEGQLAVLFDLETLESIWRLLPPESPDP